jgi:hypothetical protein
VGDGDLASLDPCLNFFRCPCFGLITITGYAPMQRLTPYLRGGGGGGGSRSRVSPGWISRIGGGVSEIEEHEQS